jgi:hypothetical protein
LRLENFFVASNERQTPQDPPASRFRADEEVGAVVGGDHEGAGQMGDDRSNLSDEKNRELAKQESEKQNKDLVRGLSNLDPDEAGVAGEPAPISEAVSHNYVRKLDLISQTIND